MGSEKAEYIVTWEIEWCNIGLSTVCEDVADDLEDAENIAAMVKDSQLALQAADPKDEKISIPTITNVRIVYRHTREIG